MYVHIYIVIQSAVFSITPIPFLPSFSLFLSLIVCTYSDAQEPVLFDLISPSAIGQWSQGKCSLRVLRNALLPVCPFFWDFSLVPQFLSESSRPSEVGRNSVVCVHRTMAYAVENITVRVEYSKVHIVRATKSIELCQLLTVPERYVFFFFNWAHL